MSGKFCVHCSAPDAGNYCGVCGRPQGDNPPRPGVDYDAIDAVGDQVDELIWRGTTWPMCILSPMCCSETKWHITSRVINFEHGCFHSNQDNVDMRRVKDLAFRRNPAQLMCGRGTIKIYSDENFGGKKKVGPVTLSRMGARK
eukprot:UC1_evm5s1946